MAKGIAPLYQIFADGVDVTAGINDRMIKLKVTLHEGMQADEVTITVDDRDFAVKPPRKGAILRVLMGYDSIANLREMGLFKVTRRKRYFKKGQGRLLDITGRAADVREAMKQPRTGEFKDTTLAGMLGEVAGRYGVGLKISPKLGQLPIKWEPQSEESDLHLVSRLGRELDAIAKWAGGKLLFLARDELELELPLQITDYIDCSVDDDDRSSHGKATAHHHDQGKAERKPETYGTDDGSEGPEAMLRHTFAGPERAKAAAKGHMQRLERLQVNLKGVLTGDPDIQAGMVVTHAWGVEMYDGSFALKTVEHVMEKAGGYTTHIDSHKGKSKKGKGGKG